MVNTGWFLEVTIPAQAFFIKGLGKYCACGYSIIADIYKKLTHSLLYIRGVQTFSTGGHILKSAQQEEPQIRGQ